MQNLDDILASHKLSYNDYVKIKTILKRKPNLVEIGIFSAMWSEHCSYKSSKKYLSGFPTKAPWVVQGPGENAGVIDIDGEYVAVFKVESHNHPSFIEPYQGAATGVGGIMRDIFTMGARSCASLNSLRFGSIEKDGCNAKYQKYLVKGVIKGIGDYGNCMGVPTLGGDTSFDECYNGNILVNAFNLGICKKDEVYLAKSEGVGNPIIYVGSKTGRDGLGGAVMSSDAFNEGSKSLRPTVQVGDPFTEKLLMEACLELFKTDYIVGIQDMGAAGLTSSAFEMASNSGSGMKLYLDKIPAREEGMSSYDFMLSESQERMLICAKKGYEQKIIDIFHKWELDCAVVGEVTDTGNAELFWHDKKAADIPVSPLSDATSMLERPIKEPDYLKITTNYTPNLDLELKETFQTLLSSVQIADKSFIYNQYDHTVGTNTIKGGGEFDGQILRIKESKKAVVMSSDCNERFCYLDPKEGAKLAVAEAGRNVAMTGAIPRAITDCLNFGNPENPEVMWQFKEACLGIREACVALETPVVSGNVSLYNETDGISVYPTPLIVNVGVLQDAQNFIPSKLQKEEHNLYIIGKTNVQDFGGSLLVKIIEKEVLGQTPKINLKDEKKLWTLFYELNEKKLLQSAKDLSSGGLAMALGKLCAKSGVGAKIDHPLFMQIPALFCETPSRALVEVASNKEVKFLKTVKRSGLKVEKIGVTIQNGIQIGVCQMEQQDIEMLFFENFERKLKEGN